MRSAKWSANWLEPDRGARDESERVDVVGARAGPHIAPQCRHAAAAHSAWPAFSSPITVRRRPAARDAPTARPAHSWCAGRQDERSTPAVDPPAHQRTPQCLARRRTPADRLRPGRRRDGRAASLATGRRIPAPPSGAGAAASPAARHRPRRAPPRRPRPPPAAIHRIRQFTAGAPIARVQAPTVDRQVSVEKAPPNSV